MRYGNLGGISKAGLAVDPILVEFGAEDAFHLRRSPAEEDPGTGAGETVDGQALRFQPGRHFGEVVRAHAKTSGILLWSQPLVIVRRVGVLLLLQQLLQGGLLGGGQPEYHGSVLDAHAAIHPALIKLGPGQGVRVHDYGRFTAGKISGNAISDLSRSCG